MLKFSEGTDQAGREQPEPWDAEALAILRQIAADALAMPREGETFRFGPDRADVEILLGFRPWLDRVIVAGSARVLATEEAGNAVLIDGSRRRIVLQGVALAELTAGDVAVG